MLQNKNISMQTFCVDKRNKSEPERRNDFSELCAKILSKK